MDEPLRKERIDERRAAVLLGLTRDQMRQLCEASGLGRQEPGESSGRRVFTYQELYWLCRLAVRAAA
jgi:hypothetical protein